MADGVGAPASQMSCSRASEPESRIPPEAAGCDDLEAALSIEEDDQFCPPSCKHHAFLDLTRIFCVALVVTDHGNGEYAQWNTVWAQHWVLQYLWVLCGVCFGLSNRDLRGYLLRLAGYFVVGYCLNLGAFVIKGFEVRGKLFDVGFHMWFVPGVMGTSICLYPLKARLLRFRGGVDPELDGGPRLINKGRAPRDTAPYGATSAAPTDGGAAGDWIAPALRFWGFVGGGTAGIVLAIRALGVGALWVLGARAGAVAEMAKAMGGNHGMIWGLPTTPAALAPCVNRWCTYLALTCSNVWILARGPRFTSRPSLVTWAMILNHIGQRCLFPRARDERQSHGFDLMVIGMAACCLGLTHRRTIGKYIARYWFIVLFVLTLFWPLGSHVRYDLTMPDDVVVRVRFECFEAAFLVL